MAETVVTANRFVNIVSVKQGDYVIKGVRSVTINTVKGRILPRLEEGKLYASGADNVGTPDFPVTTQLTFETGPKEMIDALGYAKGTLVVTLKAGDGGTNTVITIVNHQFVGVGQPQNLQDHGKPTINGVAHSADGDALPISVAAAV